MQDKILLGFLMDGPKTGYQVRALMEKSTSFFFNTSYGSIYPAFQKLESGGFVRVEERVESGKLKKIYSLTPAGEELFREWLGQGISLSRVRDEALLKIFFYDFLPQQERRRRIGDYIRDLEGQVEELKALQVNLQSLPVDFCKMATLRFGIDYYSFVREWLVRFLEEQQPDPNKKIKGGRK